MRYHDDLSRAAARLRREAPRGEGACPGIHSRSRHPLTELLHADADRVPGRSGRRCQSQFIGALTRLGVDDEVIAEAMAETRSE
jgi:hypothetical protein